MPRVIRRRSHGRSRMLRNPSITIWPASVPVSVEFCPEAKQRQGEESARAGHAQHRREQLVGVLNLRHVVPSPSIESRGGDDEDGGVDEEREHQRQGGIDRRELDRLAFAGAVNS